jgi:hypothetical protein
MPRKTRKSKKVKAKPKKRKQQKPTTAEPTPPPQPEPQAEPQQERESSGCPMWDLMRDIDMDLVDEKTAAEHIEDLKLVGAAVGPDGKIAATLRRTELNLPELPLFILRVRKEDEFKRDGYLQVAHELKLFPGKPFKELRKVAGSRGASATDSRGEAAASGRS